MRGQLRSLCNRLRDIYFNRLTAARADKLDNLDVLLSSRLDSATALTQYNMIIAAIFKPPGRFVDTLPGTRTFVVPPDIPLIWASFCGGAAGLIRNGSYIETGAAGGTVLRYPMAVTPGQVITYTIGDGGISVWVGTTALTAAGDGGDTSVTGCPLIAGGAKGARATQSAFSTRGTGGIARYAPQPWSYTLPELGVNNVVPGALGTQSSSGVAVQTAGASALFQLSEAGCGGLYTSSSLSTYRNGSPGAVMFEWGATA